jgi:hypothetical protein
LLRPFTSTSLRTFLSLEVIFLARADHQRRARHHHVESVHFTSAHKSSLHPALAVVQTPGREYYVLRDNGMQVGCEEEGVGEVWRRVIGCDERGVAV